MRIITRPASRPVWRAMAAALVLATACGSTVRSTDIRPADLVGDLGAGDLVATEPRQGPQSPLSGSVGAGVGTIGTHPPQTAPAAASSGLGGLGGQGGQAGQTAPASRPDIGGQPDQSGQPSEIEPTDARDTQVYRGATANTVLLGVLASTTSAAATQTLGFEIDTGDAIAQVRALQSWVNGAGGMGGREVELVFHERDDTSSEPPEVAYQAACDAFTQDHEVYAVMTFYYGAVMAPCLAQRDTTLIDASVVGHLDSAAYQELSPYYISPTLMSMDRYAANLIDGLGRQGYFADPQSRFGLIYGDTPQNQAIVRDVIEPAMAQHGAQLTSTFATTPEGGLDGYATQGRQMQSAMLQFRSAGVDHVMFLFPAIATLFMVAADPQAYTPRYGLGTYDSPATTQGLVSARQLEGAIGAGFMPAADVLAADQDAPVSDAEGLCLAIMDEAGLRPDSQATRISMLAHCDMFFLTKQVLDQATDITPAGFAHTAASLGRGYRAPLALQVRFAPDRHDGPSAMRPFGFDSDCPCFTHTGPTYEID